MIFDLLLTTSRGSGFEGSITAARLGLRVAIVTEETGPREPAVELRHCIAALRSVRRVSSADHLPTSSPRELAHLWNRAEQLAVREERFQRDELRRHGVDLVTDSPDVNARRVFVVGQSATSNLWTPFADCDNAVSFATLMQLPRLPHGVTVAMNFDRGLEYATFLAELGVTATLLRDRSRDGVMWDADTLENLLDRQRAGRIEVVDIGESADERIHEPPMLPEFILVETANDSRQNIASRATVFAIEDRPGAGERAVLREFGFATGEIDNPCRMLATSPPIAAAGCCEEELFDEQLPFESGAAAFPTAGGDCEGVLKILFHRHTRQLLGVQSVGENARQFADIGRAVLLFAGTIDDLRGSLFSDPTAAAPFRAAAIDGLKQLQSRSIPSLNLSVVAGEERIGDATTPGRRASEEEVSPGQFPRLRGMTLPLSEKRV